MSKPTSDSDASNEKETSAARVDEPGDSEAALGLRLPGANNARQGEAAGIEHHELVTRVKSDRPVLVTCIDYSPDQVQVRDVSDNLAAFLEEHRPPGTVVRWINIDGLSNAEIIRAVAEKYALHPLAIEDVMHVPQRPKIEDYPSEANHHARLFVIARMLQLTDGALCGEQVSMFLGHNTLLTFQESPGDVWDPIRHRLKTAGSRLRQNDASFLLYSLLDATIDYFFPILEQFSDRLEDLEQAVLASPSKETIHKVHAIKRELLLLRRAAWPMREAIHDLQREPHACVSDTTRTYLRDVYDHTVQIIDLIETYREFAGSLADTYMASASHRMNEVMKVLTILGSIFIPVTFLAGVYGMNMPIPEMNSHITYPLFWITCILIAAGMLYWFKRRGWLDS
jgi:magnesium transporter